MGDKKLDKGFPPLTVPSFKYLNRLIPQGILISIIAFVITLSAGKTFSRKVYLVFLFIIRMVIKLMKTKN